MEYTNNYMYNGEELPKLPDDLPYAHHFILWYDSQNFYMLVSSSAMPTVSGTDVIWDGSVSVVGYGLGDEGWSQGSSGDGADYIGDLAGGSFHWTNTTIYNSDGTVHLEGTPAIRIATATDEINAGVYKYWNFTFQDGDGNTLDDPKAVYTLAITNDTTGEAIVTDVDWINTDSFPKVYIYDTSPEHHTVILRMTWQDGDGLTYRGYQYIVIGEAVAAEPDEPEVKPFALHLKSFLTGLALGLSGKPLPLSKTPIGYSYNGVVLPELPEWDREGYPWAVIADATGFASEAYYRLYICADKCTVTDSTANYKAPYIWYWFTDDGWAHKGEETDNCSAVLSMVKPIWANHDIEHEDGTTYLAASEPTPVYE